MAQHAEERKDSGLRGAVSEMRRDMTMEKTDERLNEFAADKPIVPHLLDLRTLFTAVLVAGALALVTMLLFSVKLAGVVLLLGFFGAWVFLALRRYERRRRTRDVRAGEDGAEPA